MSWTRRTMLPSATIFLKTNVGERFKLPLDFRGRRLRRQVCRSSEYWGCAPTSAKANRDGKRAGQPGGQTARLVLCDPNTTARNRIGFPAIRGFEKDERVGAHVAFWPRADRM